MSPVPIMPGLICCAGLWEVMKMVARAKSAAMPTILKCAL